MCSLNMAFLNNTLRRGTLLFTERAAMRDPDFVVCATYLYEEGAEFVNGNYVGIASPIA